MNNLVNKVIIFALITVFLLSGCGAKTSPLISPTSSPTATVTFTPAPTSTPTFTPTPIPVSIKDAIAQGTLSEVKTFGKGTIRQSAFSPDGSLFIAVVSRGIYIYDTKGWQEIKYIPVSVEKNVNAIDISADGKIFAVGDSSGDVTFWNTETWEILKSVEVHEGQVTSLKISPDGLNFAAIGDKKVISTWDLKNGVLINSREQKDIATFLIYSSDGQLIITSTNEHDFGGGILARQVSNLEIAFRFPIDNYTFSPFENIMVFYNRFDGLSVWELNSKNLLLKKLPVEFQDGNAENWIFLDKSQLVVKIYGSGAFYLINLQTYDVEKISATKLASIAGNNPRAWSIIKEKEIQALGFGLGEYSPALITPDGSTLILRGKPGNPNIGAMELRQGNTAIKSIEINSNYLTMKGKNLTAINWKESEKQGSFSISEIDISDMHIISETQIKYDVNSQLYGVALSPDGLSLAASTDKGDIYLWNTKNKIQIAIPNAHQKKTGMFGISWAIGIITFSPDGKLIATKGTVDKLIKVWNVQDGKEILSISNTGEQGMIFSTDSQQIIYTDKTGIRAKPIYGDMDEIMLYENLPNEVLSPLQFSPDGSMLFSYNTSGYEIRSESKIKILSVVNKNLSIDIPLYDSVIYGNTIATNPEGTLLYIVTRDGIVSVYGHTPQK